tara:strand:+ start:298 stop:462 length:165 start_codon:yes stop_codon:yes gene_type:complete
LAKDHLGEVEVSNGAAIGGALVLRWRFFAFYSKTRENPSRVFSGFVLSLLRLSR